MNSVNGIGAVNVYYIEGTCDKANYHEERKRYSHAKLIAANLSTDEITSYLYLPDEHQRYCEIMFESAATKTQIIKAKGSFKRKRYYTTVLAGNSGSPNAFLVYGDKRKHAPLGTVMIRYIQVKPTLLGSVDVSINNSLVFPKVSYPDTGTPIYTNVQAGQLKVNTTNNLSTTFTGISGGVYTVFGSNTLITVSDLDPLKDGLSEKEAEENICLQSLSGVWYTIATINRNNTQTRTGVIITLLNDKIKIVTAYYDSNWVQIRTTTSYATPLPCNEALWLTTPNQPISQNYSNIWVIHKVDCDYCIIGNLTRSFLLILSRCKEINYKEYKKLLHIVRWLGYDTQSIVPEQNTVRKPDYYM